jgi:iron complex transport system ATP-binding protein
MSTKNNLLAVRDVDLSVGGRPLVSGLQWDVQGGECWCLIGQNGAGKSTLMRTLVGLRQPERGRVLLRDRALPAWPIEQLAHERAYLPQGRNDSFGYSVMETVLTARHPYHHAHYWESEADHRIAHQALQALEVDHLARRDIRTLSGGERQRVAIAAVLAQQTPLLLLDEPANALDLAHQVSVMRLLSALSREAGKAVIMVSHDLNLAHAVATHALLLMGDGQWLAGPVDEVMQAPLLSRCLGHPIDAIRHNHRTIFIPAEEIRHD